jgi:DNA-binding MarR family transcriptional regulator
LDHGEAKVFAFNGLNFVSAFRGAFAEANVTERVTLEHMETFFFIMTAVEQDSIELRRLHNALGYPQAKMHRTATILEKLGWIRTRSGEDARQKEITVTESGMAFFKKISQSLSTAENDSIFEMRSRDMREEIAQDTAIREARHASVVRLSPKDILAGKPRVDATVMTEGVSATGKVGKLKTQREQSDRIRRRYAKYKKEVSGSEFIAKETAKVRAELRDALEIHGEEGIEVGKNYVKTSRGIVTFAVLMKRFEVMSMREVAFKIATMDWPEFEIALTPTPKTKRDRLNLTIKRLKVELKNLYYENGYENIDKDPKLEIYARKLKSKLAVAEAEIAAITAALAVPDDEDEEHNPALRRIYSRAIERNERTKQPKLARPDDWDKK